MWRSGRMVDRHAFGNGESPLLARLCTLGTCLRAVSGGTRRGDRSVDVLVDSGRGPRRADGAQAIGVAGRGVLVQPLVGVVGAVELGGEPVGHDPYMEPRHMRTAGYEQPARAR